LEENQSQNKGSRSRDGIPLMNSPSPSAPLAGKFHQQLLEGLSSGGHLPDVSRFPNQDGSLRHLGYLTYSTVDSTSHLTSLGPRSSIRLFKRIEVSVFDPKRSAHGSDQADQHTIRETAFAWCVDSAIYRNFSIESNTTSCNGAL